MKKLYFLIVLFSLALANQSIGQTNINSGNWGDGITWGPGGLPSNPCTNCNIIIRANTTVTLNISVALKGASVLTVQSGAQLIITSSGQYLNGMNTVGIPAGHNILMDGSSTTKIVVETGGKIDATGTNSPNGTSNAGGFYDGIFSTDFNTPPVANVYSKLIGASSPLVFNGNVAYQGSLNTAPTNSSINGPATLLSSGPLPVSIVSFNAILEADAVNLAWTVEQQVDFSHFDVLHSVDGSTWQKLGTVDALPTKGTANYSFVDAAPSHGLNYYRLKAVDLDGNFKLSEVALVRGALIKGVILANPVVNGSLIVSFGNDVNSGLSVRLLNLNGQVMQERQVNNAAGSTISMSVGTYAKGIYLLHIKADDGSQKIYKVLVSN